MSNPGWAWTIFSFLVVIGPLIFIHEMGHYLVGRWFGVKAETFSIGFGREIAGWTDKRGTRWKVGWLPLGGYVRFAGDMNPASQPSPEWEALPPEEKKRCFQGKPLGQRFLIVLAGPVTNLVFAVLVIAGFMMVRGEFRTPPVIATVAPQSAAAAAGLAAGDRVLAVDGRSVERFEDISRAVILKPGERLPIVFVRDSQRQVVEAVPAAQIERDRFGNEFRKGVLGIGSGRTVVQRVPAVQVLPRAIGQAWTIIEMTCEGIAQIITGRRSVKEMGGPLKIAKFSGEQASLGVDALIGFMAMISINLGFINLLPIPMLDGGYLLFYVLEAVRRKPLRPAAQEWAFRTGLAALLALMIFVTWNDLASFGLWARLGGLIG